MKKKTQSKSKLEVLTQMQPTIKNATVVMRVIDNKFRQRILFAISELGEPSVSELYTHLGMRQEVCSIHLQSLRAVGLVKVRKEHKSVYYSVNTENLNLLFGRVKELAKQLELKISSR